MKALLKRYWWVLALAIAIGIAWYLYSNRTGGGPATSDADGAV